MDGKVVVMICGWQWCWNGVVPQCYMEDHICHSTGWMSHDMLFCIFPFPHCFMEHQLGYPSGWMSHGVLALSLLCKWPWIWLHCPFSCFILPYFLLKQVKSKSSFIYFFMPYFISCHIFMPFSSLVSLVWNGWKYAIFGFLFIFSYL